VQNFFAVHISRVACANTADPDTRCKNFHAHGTTADKNKNRKKPLFHRYFRIAVKERAMQRGIDAPSLHRATRNMNLCVDERSKRALVHGSLSRTLFFLLRCSKRNPVRVDSRRALMRHPP
jgi:hypothetical protein